MHVIEKDGKYFLLWSTATCQIRETMFVIVKYGKYFLLSSTATCQMNPYMPVLINDSVFPTIAVVEYKCCFIRQKWNLKDVKLLKSWWF